MPAAVRAMRLHVLTPAEAGEGRCLDGSPPAYYSAPAASSANSSWLIVLKGGGWCFDRYACRYRSLNFNEGSSTGLPRTKSLGGLLSGSAQVNPTFAHWHRVFVWYCDGASFTGDRSAPLIVANRSLWFRGRAALDAVVQHLLRHKGLAEASQVLLAGHSAGGLAAAIRADSVAAMLPRSASFKAVNIGGFFLQTSPQTLWGRAMRSAYALHGSAGGVAPACLAAHGGGDEGWRCLFANATAPTTRTPLFLLSSALDSWQLANLWKGRDGWSEGGGGGGGGALGCAHRCFAGKPPRRVCTPQAIASLNAFAAVRRAAAARGRAGRAPSPSRPHPRPRRPPCRSQRFVADLSRPGGWLRAGNGAFVHSCCEHDALFKDLAWEQYAVGGVSMRSALASWWAAPTSPPVAAAEHTRLPCALRAEALLDTKPTLQTSHQCNPTCAAWARRGWPLMEAPAGLQQPQLAEARLARQCRSLYVCRPSEVAE